METYDYALIDRCKAGDSAAFRELVEKYYHRAYSLAYGMIHNHEDALDIAQEAFIKVHRYLDKFQGASNFYTWLYRIVINLCIDFSRKEMKTVPIDEYSSGEEGHAIGDESADGNPLKELDKKEFFEILQKAVTDLSEVHRASIILREIHGLSYEEIAKVMNCSRGTVMSRLHHARLKLQRVLFKNIGSR